MKYDLVLFDFDGTLMDTSEGIFFSAKSTMRDLNQEIKPDVNMNLFVGPPLADSFRLTFNLKEELVEKACEIYRGYYSTVGMYKAKAYPHLEETLKKLRESGLRLGIATNKYPVLATQMAEYFGLRDYFDGIFGGSLTKKFSKADILLQAATTLKVEDHSRILMVGDTKLDLDGAKANGMDFVGVSFGFGLKEENLGLKYPLIDDFLQLLTLAVLVD